MSELSEQPELFACIHVRTKEAFKPLPHPCPFNEDVNNDSDTMCLCCSHCKTECALDI